MFNEIIVNAAIIIASLSLGNQVLINQEIAPSAPFKTRLLSSSFLGLLGVLLMINSIQIMPNIILDFRSTPIAISAIYFGFIPSVITASIIGLFRLLYFDTSFPTILGAVTALVVGLSCGLTSLLIISNQKKWMYMGLSILLIPTIGFYLLIDNHALLMNVLLTYWLGTFIILFLVYFYLHFLNLSRQNYIEYKEDSRKDHLTGLNNVRQFDSELNRVSNNLSINNFVALLFIDIDFFKKVNDKYGHQNGDKVLSDLGKILLSATNHTDIVSRNGGEEFSILITECPKENVLEVAERIRRIVAEHKFCLMDSQTINITVSIGIAIYPNIDIDKIMEAADSALYKAKQTGRNKVIIA